MRLDPDLFREILLDLEKTPTGTYPDVPVVDGHGEAEVIEYLELLQDAGLIEAKFIKSGMGGQRFEGAFVERITYEGHQFLASARNQGVWSETKKTFREKGVDFTLDLASRIMSNLAAAHLGLPPA